MTEDLVLIHTFSDPVAAGAAQGELLAAGVHCLLVSENPVAGLMQGGGGVALAVHRRDAELAATVLSLGARRGDTGSAGGSDRT